MGTTYLAFRSSDMGPYPYDTYASSLNLENRWRLNTNLSANGNTEASIGTFNTSVTVDITAGNLALTSRVTKGTSDTQAQLKASGNGTVLWAAPSGGIPSTFTVGVWYLPLTANAAFTKHLMCVGASPTYTGTYHGLEVSVTSSRRVGVQFGNAVSNTSSSRLTYYTAVDTVPAAETPVFIVVKATKSTTSGAISFEVLVNGVVFACPYFSGSGTGTLVWGDRVTFGSGHWGRSTETLFDPFDEPFFTSGLLTTTQILQLYNYGVTP